MSSTMRWPRCSPWRWFWRSPRARASTWCRGWASAWSATCARDLFAHVIRLGPAWFEIKRSGDVMSRISADAQLIEQVIGSSASVALRNTLMCIGGVAMLVITNPKLALLVLAVVPLVVAPIIVFGRKVRALSREAQARMADMVSEGGETLDAVRTVQAFAQEERAARRFAEATERAFAAARRASPGAPS